MFDDFFREKHQWFFVPARWWRITSSPSAISGTSDGEMRSARRRNGTAQRGMGSRRCRKGGKSKRGWEIPGKKWGKSERTWESWLMVWLPFFIFPYIRNNHPNWLSYFPEGCSRGVAQPPTRKVIGRLRKNPRSQWGSLDVKIIRSDWGRCSSKPRGVFFGSAIALNDADGGPPIVDRPVMGGSSIHTYRKCTDCKESPMKVGWPEGTTIYHIFWRVLTMAGPWTWVKKWPENSISERLSVWIVLWIECAQELATEVGQQLADTF